MHRACALAPALRVTFFAALIVIHGCAARQEPRYVAPSDLTVTARTEASYNGRDQYIIVHNGSSVEITITSLHLRECENIKNSCDVQRMRVKVRPGEEIRLATIQPRNAERAHGFRYGWTWEVSGAIAQPGRD
jgi:hypothetical protein